jgi:hypothetical protein
VCIEPQTFSRKLRRQRFADAAMAGLFISLARAADDATDYSQIRPAAWSRAVPWSRFELCGCGAICLLSDPASRTQLKVWDAHVHALAGTVSQNSHHGLLR